MCCFERFGGLVTDRIAHKTKPRYLDYAEVDLFRTAWVDEFGMDALHGWLGSRVVSVLNSVAESPGFKSQPRRCRVAVLGKLFTPIVASVHQTAK